MTRIFETGAPRDEQQRFERDMAIRQDLIRGSNLPRPEPAWRAPDYAVFIPATTWDSTNFHAQSQRASLDCPPRDSDADDDAWSCACGIWAVILLYLTIASGVTRGLVWLGVPHDPATTVGILWLPVLCAIVLLAVVCTALWPKRP